MKKISKLLALAVVFHGLPACADTESKAPQPVQPAAPAGLGLWHSGTAGSYLSGQFARSSGDIDRAIRHLRRAHQNDPGNADILGQLQGLLLINGNVAEAIQLIKNAPATVPKNSLAFLLLCMEAAKQGDMEQAQSILQDAYETSNGQLWLPLVTAWLDIGRGALAQPVTLEELSSEISQASALTHYHLALINSQAGFTDAAVENFKKSIADPNNPPTRIMQMMFRYYSERGKPVGLKPLMESYLEENADTNSALEDVSGIFSPQDGIAEVLFTMGNIVQSAGASQDAILYLHLAKYLKPNFPLVTLSLADSYSDLKQHEKANALYASIPQKSILYAKARMRMALNENQAGKFNQALASLDKLIQAFPNHYEPLITRGDLLRTRQRPEEAAEAYTQALRLIPELKSYHWPILFARGVCLERQGKWPAAEADLRRALALHPDQPDVLNYLGYTMLIRHERIDEAREMIEKAMALKPQDPQIADSMGWALYSLAQYEEAAAYLEKALDLVPSDPVVNDHLGDAYWQLGRRTEAKFQWERALNFSPLPTDAENLRRKLEEGLALDMSPDEKPPVVADTGRPGASVP
jgi:tetratricopeptide (TPR) repeat protein